MVSRFVPGRYVIRRHLGIWNRIRRSIMDHTHMSSEEWLQDGVFIGRFPWIPLDGELSPMRAENTGQDIFSPKLFFFTV